LPVATQVAGSPKAPVTILALSDIECPVCREFHEAAMSVVSERQEQVRLLYVHYPLAYHASALGAAIGAECAQAATPDGYRAWIEAVYAGQDSLGARPWRDYAQDAAVPDPDAQVECIASGTEGIERIEGGLAFGQESASLALPRYSSTAGGISIRLLRQSWGPSSIR